MKKGIFSLFVVLINLLSAAAFSATYYVDSKEGDDLSAGTSESLAWRTISRINSHSFLPGDFILLKRDGEWREQLLVPSGGDASSHITISAYGSGENPLILGSNIYTWNQATTAGELVMTSNETGSSSRLLRYDNNSFYHYAQGFKVSNTGSISTVQLFGRKRGAPSGNIWVEIYSGSSQPETKMAASDLLNVSSMSGISDYWYEFNFSNPVNILSGTPYFLVLKGDYIPSTTHHISWGFSSGTDPYQTGIIPYSAFRLTGAETIVADATNDFKFRINMSTGGSPVPNVWKASGVTAEPYWVWFKNSGEINWGRKEYSSNINNLDSIYNFYYNDSRKELFVFAPSNPSAYYEQIEVPQRETGIKVDAAKEYIVIENLTIRFVNKASIMIIGNGAIVQNNILEYSGIYDTENYGDGVWNESSNSLIKNNLISEHAGHGINTMAYFRNVSNVIIEGNEVYNNYHNNIDFRARFGYQMQDCIARYNTTYTTFVINREGINGIFLQGNVAENSEVTNIKVYYNKIYDQTGNGIQASIMVDHLEVYNNIVCGTRKDVYPATTACYYFFNNNGSIIMRNNIGVNGASWILRVENMSGKDFSNNIYYQEPGYSNYFARIGNTSYSTNDFAGYTAAYNTDKQSLFIDPLFINGAEKDFRLNQNSPGLNAGADVGLLKDFYGNEIIGSSDIGAFESPATFIKLQIKIFLEGAFKNGVMLTSLAEQNLVPLQNPYSSLPWNYHGPESVETINPTIVDWVLIEFRRETSSSTKLMQKALLLRNDGFVVDQNFSDQLLFNDILPGEYHVIVYHRNHLPVMSSSKLSFSHNSRSVDFTSSSSAYGTDPLADLGSNIFGMYSGDSDGNMVINVLDITHVGENIYNTGFHIHDIDMNRNINILDFRKIRINLNKRSQIPE